MKKPPKGWFTTERRDGDRTLAEQMEGLEHLAAEVQGKTVLDVGCAEGLIAIELARAGAAAVHGIEIVAGHIAMAQDMAGDLPCTFEVANLNEKVFQTGPGFDIVLALAVLHKLKDPSRVCREIAAQARDLCVIRLSPSGPVIIDARSDSVPHNIADVMLASGFVLERQLAVPRGEYLAYFRRKKPSVESPPMVIIDGPEAFASVNAAVADFEAEVAAAGGIDAWKAQDPSGETNTGFADTQPPADETPAAEEPKGIFGRARRSRAKK